MAIPLNPTRRIGFDPLDFLRPQTAAGVLGVPPVDLTAGLPPEATPVLATPPQVVVPGQEPIVGAIMEPDEANPVGGAPAIDFTRLEGTRPVYDTRRAGRTRLAGLVGTGLGLAATLATGRVTPVGAIGAGIAGGAGRSLGEQDQGYASQAEAYRQALVKLTEKEADLVNNTRERESAERINTADNIASGERNTATVAGQKYGYDLAFRTNAERATALAAQQSTDRLETQLKTLVDNGGTVENMTPIVAQVLGLPDTPEGLEQARSIASSFRTDYETGVAMDRARVDQGWRGLALQAGGLALRQQEFRAGRDDEYYDRRNPSGGSNGPTGTQQINAYSTLMGMRAKVGLDREDGGISQGEYDTAERIYVNSFGAMPQAEPGNFSRLFGMVPGADPLEGIDLSNPRNRQILIDNGYDPDDL